MNAILKVLAVLSVITIGGTATIFGQDKPQSAQAITRITKPLLKDGTVDYIGAINLYFGKDVTPENSANVLLWQAFGPAPHDENVSDEYFRLIAIEPPPKAGDYLVDLTTFLKAKGLTEIEIDRCIDERETAKKRVWQTTEFPRLAVWISANEKPAELITRAAKRTRYFSPLVLPPKEGKRAMIIEAQITAEWIPYELTNYLLARSMLRVSNKQVDAA